MARVQYMSGEVSMQPGGVNDWIAASMNRPLTTADRVWTDKDSRAELNVGDGFIRMNSETSLTLTNVSDNTVQVQLDQGVLEVTVKHLEKGEIYEIDTPNIAFTVMKTGVYRFDVHPNEDQTWVTVRSGYGMATGKGPAVRVNSGLQVRFSGGNSLQNASYSAPPRDGFEDWAQVRDKRLDDSLSARYVSPGVIGYQDLDAYGTWQVTVPYGAIWVPSGVPVGWAPYRYGSWAWIAPWGWTWVDSAPWGFAPFHYGRWVSWNGGWGWAPGPLGYWNPYYAPALVGWIGGPGFGIGFGWGWGGGWGFGVGAGFGWFPLGWGAPYYPRYCGWGHGYWGYGSWGYHGGYVSNAYLRNVNLTNTHIANINNISNNYYHGNLAGNYVNRNIAGAVTAAPRSAFTSGAAINRVGTVVPRSDLGKGQLVRMADVSPTKESVLGGHTPLTRGTPPASAFNRSVITRATPPGRPASFEANQAAMARANAGREANHSTEMAKSSAPANPAGHYVPRPPERNDSFARGNSSMNNHETMNHSSQGTAGTTTARNSQVPRPPANYTYHAPSATPRQSAPSHQSAPSQHAAPQGNSHGSSQGNSRGSSHSSANGASRCLWIGATPARRLQLSCGAGV